MWQKLVSYLLTTTFLALYASLKSSSATKVPASVILVFRFHPSAVFNSRFHIIALPESELRTFFVFSNSLRVSNYPLFGGQVGGVMNRVKARFVVITATSSRNRDIVIYRREPVEECECFQIIFRITNLYLECSDTITSEVRKSYLVRSRYFTVPYSSSSLSRGLSSSQCLLQITNVITHILQTQNSDPGLKINYLLVH